MFQKRNLHFKTPRSQTQRYRRPRALSTLINILSPAERDPRIVINKVTDQQVLTLGALLTVFVQIAVPWLPPALVVNTHSLITPAPTYSRVVLKPELDTRLKLFVLDTKPNLRYMGCYALLFVPRPRRCEAPAATRRQIERATTMPT
ncbi:unnamed protein product, partial [Iphiclides podalirius]